MDKKKTDRIKGSYIQIATDLWATVFIHMRERERNAKNNNKQFEKDLALSSKNKRREIFFGPDFSQSFIFALATNQPLTNLTFLSAFDSIQDDGFLHDVDAAVVFSAFKLHAFIFGRFLSQQLPSGNRGFVGQNSPKLHAASQLRHMRDACYFGKWRHI